MLQSDGFCFFILLKGNFFSDHYFSWNNIRIHAQIIPCLAHWKPDFINSTSKLLNSQTNTRLSNQTMRFNQLKWSISKSRPSPTSLPFVSSISLNGLSGIKESFRTRTNMCWNKWHHPPTASPSWYFQVWVCVRKSGGSRDEGETFEDEEICLNPHPLFWVPAGGVYMGKASHVLFRGSSGSVLDQGLIERGCDCCFLHKRLHREWRWTCDHHSELDQYVHTLTVKCGEEGKKKLQTLRTCVEQPCL